MTQRLTRKRKRTSIRKKWKTYEEVSVYLLNHLAKEFKLEKVEGKQAVPGRRSGTRWNIDAKGIKQGNEGFIIIECRCYTTSRQNQEKMGALAYRIKDTGAKGGIIVSPFDVQKGAAKVAAAENIQVVVLDENSTTTNYILRFLNKLMIGVGDTMTLRDHVDAIVVKKSELENGT